MYHWAKKTNKWITFSSFFLVTHMWRGKNRLRVFLSSEISPWLCSFLVLSYAMSRFSIQSQVIWSLLKGHIFFLTKLPSLFQVQHHKVYQREWCLFFSLQSEWEGETRVEKTYWGKGDGNPGEEVTGWQWANEVKDYEGRGHDNRSQIPSVH